MDKLNDYRKKIDKIDKQIVDLLVDRLKCAKTIGKIKNKSNSQIYVPFRESKLIKKIIKYADGRYPITILKRIFFDIISVSLQSEGALSIAYLGPEGSFTNLVALSKFGNNTKYIPRKSIHDIFLEVELKRTNYGVVPIENSNQGAVTYTLDSLVNSELKIMAEILFPVTQNLMSKSQEISKIKKIYSHPQCFGQCEKWLNNNLAQDVDFVEVSSTSEASKLASNNKTYAAIGSELSSRIYGLNIIAKNIEDSKNNVTRFFIIGNKLNDKSGADKTSIAFAIKDKVGALYNCLHPFFESKINLTKIESRPAKNGLWEYIFFVDFIGHYNDTKSKKAINKLKKYCTFIKILGSYPNESY